MIINRAPQNPAAAPTPARSNVLRVAEHFPVNPLTLGLDAVDVTASLAYGLSGPSDSIQVFGGVAAAAHGLTGLIVGMNGVDATTKEARDYAMNRFWSEELLALGHLVASQGLGAWALPIIGAGFLGTNLAQLRAPKT